MAFLPDVTQNHFIVHELRLPYCTVCTPVETVTGAWHTPLTCEESSDSTYSLFFTKSTSPIVDAPSQAISGISQLNNLINRIVKSESYSTTELTGGTGLSSRGTMSITLTDKAGDPGPIEFSESGTFLGKLAARNVLEGKELISHFYSVGSDGAPVVVKTMTHYVVNAYLSNGVMSIKAKDALKDLEAFSIQYPDVGEIELVDDIDETQTIFEVTDHATIQPDSRYRLGDEIIWVKDKLPDEFIEVEPRGTGLSDGTRIIYKTKVDSHTAGTTLQPCIVYNGEPVAQAMYDLFQEVGIASFADKQQWEDEIEQWDGDAFLYGVLSEPNDAADVINMMLSEFTLDMWLDQDTQKVLVSTNTPWKEANETYEEGNDLQNYSVKTSQNSRFSRAYVWVGKEFQAANDDIQNYSRAISETNLESEESDFYGSASVMEFDPAPLLSSASGRRLAARFIQRFAAPPREVTFEVEERKAINMSVSTVINAVTRDKQSPSGEVVTSPDRIQITKMQPVTSQIGRKYQVTALGYIPLFATDPGEEQYKIYTNSDIRGINLAAEVNAPTDTDLNYTFVFDNCTIGSAEEAGDWLSAITAGAWSSGSRIRIILTNGSTWSAKGGTPPIFDVSAPDFVAAAVDGYDAYNSSGIATEIYLAWSDIDGYTPSGELFASGGGGEHRSARYDTSISTNGATGWGGGGSGIPGGLPNIETGNPPPGDGVFENGGVGGYAYSVVSGFPDVWARGGAGGDSVDGGLSSSGGADNVISTVDGSSAGFAVTGGGSINIYGTTASFRRGSSVDGVDYDFNEWAP